MADEEIQDPAEPGDNADKGGGDFDLEDFDPDLDLGDGKDSQTIDTDDKAKKEDKGPSIEDRMKAMESTVGRLERDKKNLQKALHEERQSKKGSKGEEIELTDDQVLAIIEEHKGDAKVMLNAMKYYAAQEAKKAGKRAVDETELKGKKAEIDRLMKQRYPDIENEDSDIRKGINETKDALGINEHPFGDYFAAGVNVLNHLPQIVKHWYEQGKKAALDTKTEKARDKQIKDGDLTPSTKGKAGDLDGTGLSASQLEAAKRVFGPKPTKQQLTLYKNQVLASSRKPSKKEEED